MVPQYRNIPQEGQSPGWQIIDILEGQQYILVRVYTYFRYDFAFPIHAASASIIWGWRVYDWPSQNPNKIDSDQGTYFIAKVNEKSTWLENPQIPPCTTSPGGSQPRMLGISYVRPSEGTSSGTTLGKVGCCPPGLCIFSEPLPNTWWSITRIHESKN